jgi:hypothetical protein
MRPQGSPKRAPDYNLIRFVTANDSIGTGYKTKGAGCNWGNFLNGNIQVVPINTADAKLLTEPLGDLVAGATSNPALAIRYWNEDLQMYVPHNPAQTIAAAGAGLAYEATLPPVNGRMIFLEVTGGVTAGQGVLIFGSGSLYYESI